MKIRTCFTFSTCSEKSLLILNVCPYYRHWEFGLKIDIGSRLPLVFTFFCPPRGILDACGCDTRRDLKSAKAWHARNRRREYAWSCAKAWGPQLPLPFSSPTFSDRNSLHLVGPTVLKWICIAWLELSAALGIHVLKCTFSLSSHGLDEGEKEVKTSIPSHSKFQILSRSYRGRCLSGLVIHGPPRVHESGPHMNSAGREKHSA